MERPADDGESGRRIGLFCVGVAVAAGAGFVGAVAFLLATVKMDPALSGGAYWAAVRDRFQTNLTLTGMMLASAAGSLCGLWLMARAVRGPSHRAGVRR